MTLTDIAADKLGHYVAGTLACLAGIAAMHVPALVGMLHPELAGIVVCFGAAVGREAYNATQGGEFDLKDIAATMAGGAVVAVASALA